MKALKLCSSGYHSNGLSNDNTCMNVSYVVGHERKNDLLFRCIVFILNYLYQYFDMGIDL
jgi:hypothetical protein